MARWLVPPWGCTPGTANWFTLCALGSGRRLLDHAAFLRELLGSGVGREDDVAVGAVALGVVLDVEPAGGAHLVVVAAVVLAKRVGDDRVLAELLLGEARDAQL